MPLPEQISTPETERVKVPWKAVAQKIATKIKPRDLYHGQELFVDVQGKKVYRIRLFSEEDGNGLYLQKDDTNATGYLSYPRQILARVTWENKDQQHLDLHLEPKYLEEPGFLACIEAMIAASKPGWGDIIAHTKVKYGGIQTERLLALLELGFKPRDKATLILEETDDSPETFQAYFSARLKKT